MLGDWLLGGKRAVGYWDDGGRDLRSNFRCE